jgi:hypothetical protein
MIAVRAAGQVCPDHFNADSLKLHDLNKDIVPMTNFERKYQLAGLSLYELNVHLPSRELSDRWSILQSISEEY